MKKYIFTIRFFDKKYNRIFDAEISTMANSYPTAFYRAVAVAFDETTASKQLQVISVTFKAWG